MMILNRFEAHNQIMHMVVNNMLIRLAQMFNTFLCAYNGQTLLFNQKICLDLKIIDLYHPSLNQLARLLIILVFITASAVKICSSHLQLKVQPRLLPSPLK